jgi:hypothetical protein
MVNRKRFCAYRSALVDQLALLGYLNVSHKYGEDLLHDICLQKRKYEISEARSAKNVVTAEIDVMQLNSLETLSRKRLTG